MTPNRKALLDTIAFSELGVGLLAASDNGYNVIVGSTALHPILFHAYGDHPRHLMRLQIKGRVINSTAAGRYQILAKYFDAYKKLLKLPDFSPASQDAIAVQMLKEQGALKLIDGGDFAGAVKACRNIWASLPGAGYGQHENTLNHLQEAYVRSGGALA